MKQNLYLYGWILGENMEHGKNIHGILQPLRAETYAEACQTSKMELFAKIVNG